MRNNKVFSDSWAWAQAIAIDASLGVVFTSAVRAIRGRDWVKAGMFLALTVLLATVAGLITHFDSYAHAAGLPVTDRRVSGIVPLWIMTALRAVAVIGFLLTSRLQDVSFTGQDTSEEWGTKQKERSGQIDVPQMDYRALVAALSEVFRQAESVPGVVPSDEQDHDGLKASSGTSGDAAVSESMTAPDGNDQDQVSSSGEQVTGLPQVEALQNVADNVQNRPYLTLLHFEDGASSAMAKEPPKVRMARAYQELQRERTAVGESKPISARDLAQRAKVRRATCSVWLKMQEQMLNIDQKSVVDEKMIEREK